MKYLRAFIAILIAGGIVAVYFFYYLPQQQKSYLSPLSSLPVPSFTPPQPVDTTPTTTDQSAASSSTLADASGTVAVVSSTAPTSTVTSTLPNPQLPMPPTTTKQYIATLETTDGAITIELNKDQTPNTVKNFVTLAEKNFYDKTIFHRVIKGFMIQGGDPTGTGSGGPGYTFADEPFTGDYTRGTVAMANAGPNTNGSQFFIMQDTVALPKNYVIFGHVTNGLSVVDKIANAAVEESSSGEDSKPINPVMIKSVMITEK